MMMMMKLSMLLLLPSSLAYLLHSPSSFRKRNTMTMCAESVSERLRVECLDSLSRLGSRLSHVEISTIKDVRIVSVEEEAVKVELVSCEDDRCVSLLVPLAFPVRCEMNAEGFDECVIGNVRRLDMASAEVERFEQSQDSLTAATSAMTSAKFTLLDGSFDAASKPSWWRDPVDAELSQACHDARAILNSKDFEHDLRSVATKLASASVAAAKVVNIGPTGILINALDAASKDALSLALPFDTPCQDPVTLRRTIVGAVSA